jgi:hypothetical protein
VVSATNRLAEIQARLRAANLTRPVRVRVGYEGARHIPLIDHGRGLDAEVVARIFEEDEPWARAELIANAPADLSWATAEIERLRAALQAIADTKEAIRYEAGENDPIRVAAWLVEPRHMDAARAALKPIAPVGAATETEEDRA